MGTLHHPIDGRPDAIDSFLCLLNLLYKLDIIDWDQYSGRLSGLNWAEVLAYAQRHAPLHPEYDPDKL